MTILKGSSANVENSSIEAWQLNNFEQAENKSKQDNTFTPLRKDVKEQAQEYATLIKKKAYEEAYKKGSDEGFKQGLQIGKLEGKKQISTETIAALQPKVASLQNLIESMHNPYQQISEEMFLNLVNMVTEISSQVIKQEINDNSEWITSVLKNALVKLPSETENIVVSLNPIDMQVIEQYADKNKKKWQLIADETLTIGTCKIKQNSSSLVDDWKIRLVDIMEQTQQASKNIIKNSAPQA